MKLLETKLTGQNKIILSSSPRQIADRLQGRPLIAETRVLDGPVRSVALARAADQPGKAAPLGQRLAGAAFHHAAAPRRALEFKGEFDGERGAKAYFLKSRRSDDNLAKSNLSPQERALWGRAKQDASYWLGLIAFEQQNYDVAADYFARRTLELSPGGPWTEGARYNLARTYESSDQLDKAIDLLQSDSSPQKHGNRLRARRLKAQLAARAGDTATPPGEPAESASAE